MCPKLQGESVLGSKCLLGALSAWRVRRKPILYLELGQKARSWPGGWEGPTNLGLESWEGDLLGSRGGLILGLMKRTIGGSLEPIIKYVV